MISIIIPTLNEESVIANTIKRLTSKLTIPYELIISDGKSKDKTVEIARSLGVKVVEFTGDWRQTIAEGRNDGARHAQGEFVAFLDADCRITDPDVFFTAAIKRFDDAKLQALVTWVKVMPEYATFADKSIYFAYNNYLATLNNVFGFGMSGGEFQMFRRATFESIGGYNPKLVASEDVDILQRISKKGKILMDRNLIVLHTGRRAHKVGWPKLLWTWSRNATYMLLTKKAHSDEWEPIR